MHEGVIIHPTAIVHEKARIGSGTRIGAYTTIGEDVSIGTECDIQNHVVINGVTRIGKETRIFPFSAIGGEPQHLKYRGEPTEVEIGDRVTLRECVTVHRGTTQGMGITRVESGALLMAYTHVAHDCVVGKNSIIANACQMGGHVEVGEHVTIGGQVAIAQFCRIGKFAFVAGASTIRKDLAPYLMGKGMEFEVQGINAIGLSRNGYSPEDVSRLKKLYKIFFLQNLTVSHAIEKTQMEVGEDGITGPFLDFIRTSKAGLHR